MSKCKTPRKISVGGTEDLQVRKLPLREAIQMAINGEIRDLISVASLLKVHYLMENNLISFDKKSCND